MRRKPRTQPKRITKDKDVKRQTISEQELPVGDVVEQVDCARVLLRIDDTQTQALRRS
jgi:hypothetical protein